jgi:hypothetical protein
MAGPVGAASVNPVPPVLQLLGIVEKERLGTGERTERWKVTDWALERLAKWAGGGRQGRDAAAGMVGEQYELGLGE